MRRETIDAEAARFIIGRHLGEDDPQIGEQRDAALWWAVQRRIVEKGSPRSARLAELHNETLMHPENTPAFAERDKFLEEIASEAEKEVAEMTREIAAGKRRDYFQVEGQR